MEAVELALFGCLELNPRAKLAEQDQVQYDWRRQLPRKEKEREREATN